MFRFSQLLREYLKHQELTQTAFAALVGRSRAYINAVARDLRGPPDDVATWADALRLTGSERDEFLDIASIAVSPRRTQELLAAVYVGYGVLRPIRSKYITSPWPMTNATVGEVGKSQLKVADAQVEYPSEGNPRAQGGSQQDTRKGKGKPNP